MDTQIVIIGGGIGGLTAALSLEKRGFKNISIYERAPEIAELGVGISMLPHASNVLIGLNLGEELHKIGVEIGELAYYSDKGHKIYSEPRGRKAGFPSPQYGVHRGKLQTILYKAVLSRLGRNCIHVDHELTGFEEINNGKHVICHFKSGLKGKKRESVQGELVIGADGIKSIIRGILYPNQSPRFTGWVIYRGAVLTDGYLDNKTMLTIGKGDTLIVMYPMEHYSEDKKKALINWGAVKKVTTGPSDENWQKKANKEDFIKYYRGWNFGWLDIEKLIEKTNNIMEYHMHDRDPVDKWSFGRVTLLGDAAHPLLPFGSQGAAQAILDADALALALLTNVNNKNPNYDVVNGLLDYEKARAEIAKDVVLNNRQMGPTRILKVFEENPNVTQEQLKEISHSYQKTAGVRSKL